MKRRIFAWVLLIGFLFLLLNLIVFRYYWQLSMAVYLVIAFAFLFTNGRFNTLKNNQEYDPDDDKSGENDDGNAADGKKESDGNDSRR